MLLTTIVFLPLLGALLVLLAGGGGGVSRLARVRRSRGLTPV